MLLFLFMNLSLAAELGPIVEVLPATPVETCHFVWLQAEADLLSDDPLTPEPCGTWDPASYDAATSSCAFWCGSDYYWSAL